MFLVKTNVLCVGVFITLVFGSVHSIDHDVLVALDTSGSVNNSEFEKQQNGVIKILETMFGEKDSLDTITVSGISFSSKANSHFNSSNEIISIKSLLWKIQSLSTGQSYLDVALAFAQKLFNDGIKSKKNKKEILIIATEAAEKTPSRTWYLLRHLEQMNVKVTGVFVGVPQYAANEKGFYAEQAIFVNSFEDISGSAATITKMLRFAECPSGLVRGSLDPDCVAVEGESCQYSCNDGFSRNPAVKDLVCLKTGEWNVKLDNLCLVKNNCSLGISDGTFNTGCSGAAGARCNFTCSCQDSTCLTIDAVCLDSGTWSTNFGTVCLSFRNSIVQARASEMPYNGYIPSTVVFGLLCAVLVIVGMVLWVRRKRKSKRVPPRLRTEESVVESFYNREDSADPQSMENDSSSQGAYEDVGDVEDNGKLSTKKPIRKPSSVRYTDSPTGKSKIPPYGRDGSKSNNMSYGKDGSKSKSNNMPYGTDGSKSNNTSYCKDGAKFSYTPFGRAGAKSNTTSCGKDGAKSNTTSYGKDGAKSNNASYGKDGAKSNNTSYGKDGAKSNTTSYGKDGVKSSNTSYGKNGAKTEFSGRHALESYENVEQELYENCQTRLKMV